MPKLTLTRTPQQITNGSQSAYISSVNGRSFSFIHSDASPTDLNIAHSSHELSVSAPFKIWAWSNAEVDIDVIVSVAQE